MKKLKIALLQLSPGNSREEALQKGLNACREAKLMGAEIALFPEMWSSGYCIPENRELLNREAVSLESDFVAAFGALAARLNMAIGITLLERRDPLPCNTLVLFDRYGENVLTYAKVHTCDFGDECRLSAGDDFYVTALDTVLGPVQVGAMICYDREFPESARILMLKGAEIILVPNACPMEINRLSQLRARAFENMTAIATCNYPAAKPDCNGHSTAFDGVAYEPDGSGARDMCILEAGEAEGIYLAEFDLDSLRAYRREEVHGNAYRHPEKYHQLIDKEIREPFLRADRRK